MTSLFLLLVVQGKWLSVPPVHILVASRVECATACYRNSTCSSFFYDRAENKCHLSNTVYEPEDLDADLESIDYFVWGRGDCNNGYTWHRSLMLCYKFYRSPKDWNDSNIQCNHDGGHFVKVTDAGVSLFLNRLVNVLVFGWAAWIGGSDLDMNNVWEWSDGTLIGNETFWDTALNQPNDLSESCVAVYMWHATNSNSWHDFPCNTKLMFVCQKDMLLPFVC